MERNSDIESFQSHVWALETRFAELTSHSLKLDDLLCSLNEEDDQNASLRVPAASGGSLDPKLVVEVLEEIVQVYKNDPRVLEAVTKAAKDAPANDNTNQTLSFAVKMLEMFPAKIWLKHGVEVIQGELELERAGFIPDNESLSKELRDRAEAAYVAYRENEERILTIAVYGEKIYLQNVQEQKDMETAAEEVQEAFAGFKDQTGIQTYVGGLQRAAQTLFQTKLNGVKSMEEMNERVGLLTAGERMDIARFRAVQEMMGGGGSHGHSHDGKPCGGHGHQERAPQSGHSHDGKPCGGHGHSHGGDDHEEDDENEEDALEHGHSHGDNDEEDEEEEENTLEHGHSHEGKPCGGHGHSHGDYDEVDEEEEENELEHGHSHDGKPCGGHGLSHDGHDEDEEEHSHSHSHGAHSHS